MDHSVAPAGHQEVGLRWRCGLSLAGFQVIINGRFWVITEEATTCLHEFLAEEHRGRKAGYHLTRNSRKHVQHTYLPLTGREIDLCISRQRAAAMRTANAPQKPGRTTPNIGNEFTISIFGLLAKAETVRELIRLCGRIAAG